MSLKRRQVYPRIFQTINTGTKAIELSEVHNTPDEELSK